jgi:riboflavin kinase/FMN adenylyltransferase
MKRLIRDADGPYRAVRGSVVCIGAFDGVHRGHQALLEQVRERAVALGCVPAAVSFEPLPRQHFQGAAAVPRLSSPRQRIAWLFESIDLLAMLRFGRPLAATEAEAFVERTLVGRLAAREVWVGPGFRFGHGRKGDIALLHALGQRHGFVAREVAPLESAGERISSSRIRAALADSDFTEAQAMLGRPFVMGGHVVRGQQLGRKLGYPTANLRVPYGRAPVGGIFAARVSGAGLARWPAVASLGTRPTVGGVEPLLEAHLFDFDGDLYGQRLEVEFVAKLRDEERFADLDTMVAQIHRDAQAARAVLAPHPAPAGNPT